MQQVIHAGFSALDAGKQELLDKIREHSFLRRCRAGLVSIEELKILLVQQGLYSGYFTRYVCTLMGNLQNKSDVLRLASNLCEELGLTADSAIPHSLIYAKMLTQFGLTMEGAKPLVGTRRLIDTMFDHCRDPRPARGLGALCLGAEALVPYVYADIIKAFEACDTPKENLEFFHIHVECDDGHADTMWDIMLEMTKRDPDQVAYILSAGSSLIDARLEFFSAIERAAKTASRRKGNTVSLDAPRSRAA